MTEKIEEYRVTGAQAGATRYVYELQQDAFRTAKGDVLKEFEKICPTEASFKRVKKDMHDVFERLEAQLSKQEG